MDNYNKNEGGNYVRDEKRRSGRPFFVLLFIFLALVLFIVRKSETADSNIVETLTEIFGAGKTNVAISGNVSSVEGDAFFLASVSERDNKGCIVTSTLTYYDGNFSMVVKNTKNTLVVRMIGYKSKNISIGSRTVFNVELEKE